MPQIHRTQISELFRDLALLTNNGIALPEALGIIQRGASDHLPFRSLVKNIADDIKQGRSVADSLAQYPQHFPHFICRFLRDNAEDLPLALEKIADYREQFDASDVNLSTRFRLTLIYPVLVLFVGLAIVAMMMIFVIPVFNDLFSDFGAELPALTSALVALSDAWYLVVAGIVVLAVFCFAGGNISHWRSALLLRFFSLGTLYRYTIMSRVLRTWAFILDNGGSIKEAVEAAPEAVDDRYFSAVMQRVAVAVRSGKHITDVLEAETAIPRKVIYAVEAGLRSEQAPVFFNKLANTYTERARLLIDPAMRVIWVLLLLGLWLIVSVVVVGMYLPIFKIGSVI